MTTDDKTCQFCEEFPVAGFNDVLFCEGHVNEGIGEAARLLAVASDIKDPQRIAAMTEKLTMMYYEADQAVESEEMKIGDSIYGTTAYDEGNN